MFNEQMKNEQVKIERIKFSRRLAEVCEMLGIEERGRQTALAKMYKKTQPAAKKWVDGTNIPDYEICVDIAKRAGVNFEWFMTGRGDKNFSKMSEWPFSIPYEQFMKLRPEDIERIDAMIKAYVSTPNASDEENKGLGKTAAK